MENIKRSTSRDFRINTASLEAALHELSDEESENGETSVETETSEVSEINDLNRGFFTSAIYLNVFKG